MKLSFRQSVYGLLVAIIIIGGYLSRDFFFKKAGEPSLPAKIYRIGILSVDKDVRAGTMGIFADKMKELGYAEGVNVEYVRKDAVGENAKFIDQYAKELNDAGLDIIITGATSSTFPLKKLPNLKTPVLSLGLGSIQGIINNPAAPEGYFTGIRDGSLEYNSKRLSLLKEADPTIKKIISIIDRNHSNTPNFVKSIEDAAGQLGFTMVFIYIENFSDPKEILTKIPLVTKKLGDAYITCACASGSRSRKELAAQLKKEKLSSITLELEQGADVGFLLSYADDKHKPIELGAKKTDQILKGSPVSKVPVEFASDVVLELNLATAKSLGLEIPNSIISNANKTYNE